MEPSEHEPPDIGRGTMRAARSRAVASRASVATPRRDRRSSGVRFGWNTRSTRATTMADAAKAIATHVQNRIGPGSCERTGSSNARRGSPFTDGNLLRASTVLSTSRTT
jgi:hypothetical protein